MFVNGDLASDGVFARSPRVFERPWIAALLARHDPLTPTTSVQYLALTDPASNGATIMVVRTDGEVFYTGRLARRAEMLAFLIRDVARKGTAPTNVSGRLTGRGVEFDVRVPFGSRRDTASGDLVASNAPEAGARRRGG